MSTHLSNYFLSSLSPGSRNALISQCAEHDLSVGAVLYDTEKLPRYAYFLTSGLASVVTSMSGGATAEVGFIGTEGIVGSLQLLGSAPLATRCMMQLAGHGLRIPFAAMQSAFDSSEEIRRRVLEFVQEQAIMIAQIAGCNRLHTAEKRLIRWLLMAQDRAHTDVLTFTHEYLAEMIGSRRTTVTVLAGNLQDKKLITYHRGKILIQDRQGLEATACACYPIVGELYRNLYRREGLSADSVAGQTDTVLSKKIPLRPERALVRI